MRLRRFWLVLILSLAVSPPHGARGQPGPAAQTPLAASQPRLAAPQTPFAASLSPEQARAALDTLNDPKKRAAFAATLEALVRNQPAATPPPGTPPPGSVAAEIQAATGVAVGGAPSTGETIELAPDSLGAQILLSASAFLNEVADSVPRAIKAAQSLPLLWGWVVAMITNPLGQQLLLDAGWRLLATLAFAEAVALALKLLLRRPMARVLLLGQRPQSATVDEDPEARAEVGAIEPPPHPLRHGMEHRIVLGLTRFALQMVPVFGLLLAGHSAAASSLGGRPDTRLVIIAVLEAVAARQTLLAIATLIFVPDPPGLKLLPLRPATGAYLFLWARRVILIAVPGYAIGEVALLLGLSPAAHVAWQKTVGLALVVCAEIIVVQRRRPVRRWLSAPPSASGFRATIRNLLARSWAGIATFFLVAGWLSWALRAPDAVARIVWYFIATAAVMLAATIARAAVITLLDPIEPATLSTKGQTAATGHAVRVRMSAYHAALRRTARLAIDVIALLGLSQLYGLGGLNWLLTSDVGHRIAGGFCTIAVTIMIAFAAWEGVNIALQVHLETLRREAQLARSARLRTVLPLIRTTLAITVLVVAGLMVLSEIGVNTGPLLAGAGIVGVAIGFGSQKLVQDVITGVFLLLENTMQVGDVVKVGDQTGVVESLSVRTIRLRTEDGSVVVIPFSAVTTVINMTRDYSRAVITANIEAGQDVDRVIETMRAIVREMREEAAWSTVILDELEVWGLDRITDTALQIKCRIMCTPFGRWPVGREFNRRLRQRFELVGVANSFSALKLMLPGHLPSEQPVLPAESDAQPDLVQ